MNLKKVNSPTDRVSTKPLTEQETRQKLFTQAKQLGIAVEYKQLMEKYEGLLKRCTNPSERNHLTVLANIDLHKLFGFQNALVIDGVEVIPAQPGFDLNKAIDRII